MREVLYTTVGRTFVACHDLQRMLLSRGLHINPLLMANQAARIRVGSPSTEYRWCHRIRKSATSTPYVCSYKIRMCVTLLVHQPHWHYCLSEAGLPRCSTSDEETVTEVKACIGTLCTRIHHHFMPRWSVSYLTDTLRRPLGSDPVDTDVIRFTKCVSRTYAMLGRDVSRLS